MADKEGVTRLNGIGAEIEDARAELNSLAARYGYDLQHEEVQAASQRLDLLILQSQTIKQNEG